MNLGDADRIIVTTFDAAGQPTASAEFVVPLAADRVAVWTPTVTPWQERLSLSPVVSIQAASARGRALRTEPVLEGRAELVTAGAEFDAVEERTREKYGLRARWADAVDRAWEWGGHRTPHAAVIVHIVG